MKPSLPSSSAFSIGFSSFGFRTYIADTKQRTQLSYISVEVVSIGKKKKPKRRSKQKFAVDSFEDYFAVAFTYAV
jgi:hypothetical protein